MNSTVDALIVDLLNWIGPGSRPYPEVIDAWRTSCPKLPVWEDATDRGFLDQHDEGGGVLVSVSERGQEFLRAAVAAQGRMPSRRS
jgi:D-3-phosphoglycerate dehydrogenase